MTIQTIRAKLSSYSPIFSSILRRKMFDASTDMDDIWNWHTSTILQVLIKPKCSVSFYDLRQLRSKLNILNLYGRCLIFIIYIFFYFSACCRQKRMKYWQCYDLFWRLALYGCFADRLIYSDCQAPSSCSFVQLFILLLPTIWQLFGNNLIGFSFAVERD